MADGKELSEEELDALAGGYKRKTQSSRNLTEDRTALYALSENDLDTISGGEIKVPKYIRKKM